MAPAPVPLCDIALQYERLRPELDAAVLRVLHSGQVILGPEVAAFERECAEFCGSRFALGCSSGTDALVLALAALGVGPGDEVVIPTFTFFATAGSVVRVGATPVFCDIDPVTYNIDVAQVRVKITSRTKAIIPVHLFGRCADMHALQQLADELGIDIIEDAAQSFGSEYRGVRCGTLGRVGCFSFYPSKNLGTMGDAGLVTTESPEIHAKLVALRNHGSEVKYYHKYIGWNGRIDAVQAALLRVKLPRVGSWLELRRRAAARYHTLIVDAGLDAHLVRPTDGADGYHTFNQYVVRVKSQPRDVVLNTLKSNGIGCEVYYPLPLHLQECLARYGHGVGDFPVAEAAAREVLALPMFPEITESQQRRVVEVLAESLAPAARTSAA